MTKNFAFTRRTVLVSLVVIGLAAAGAGAGTMALFSDTETSSDNTVSAGTLDLTVNGGNQDVQLIDVSDGVPGDSGSGTYTLANGGTIDGYLDFSISVSENENGLNEAEQEVDNSPNEGELADALEVNVTTDEGDQITSGWEPASNLEGDFDQNLEIPAQDSVDLNVQWRIPESVGNEIQSDSVTVDVTFELNQQASGQ